MELETHALLLQVMNQHFSVLAALRCACPAPIAMVTVDTHSLLTLFAIVRRARDLRRDRGDSDCCAV